MNYLDEFYPLFGSSEVQEDFPDVFENDLSRDYYLEGKRAIKDGVSLLDCSYEDIKFLSSWKTGWQSATLETII